MSNPVKKFTENFPTTFRKTIFLEVSPKSFCQGFSVDFQSFPELFENSLTISREKIISHEFCQERFPKFYYFLNFSENFETYFFSFVQQLNPLAEYRYPAR